MPSIRDLNKIMFCFTGPSGSIPKSSPRYFMMVRKMMSLIQEDTTLSLSQFVRMNWIFEVKHYNYILNQRFLMTCAVLIAQVIIGTQFSSPLLYSQYLLIFHFTKTLMHIHVIMNIIFIYKTAWIKLGKRIKKKQCNIYYLKSLEEEV